MTAVAPIVLQRARPHLAAHETDRGLFEGNRRAFRRVWPRFLARRSRNAASHVVPHATPSHPSGDRARSGHRAEPRPSELRRTEKTVNLRLKQMTLSAILAIAASGCLGSGEDASDP